MSTTKTWVCKGCGTPLSNGRHGPPPPGHAAHAGRDRCNACYRRLRTAGLIATRQPAPDCTALTGDCTCWACRKAADDDESPLDLGGAWVLHPIRRTQVWRVKA